MRIIEFMCGNTRIVTLMCENMRIIIVFVCKYENHNILCGEMQEL